MINDSTFWIFQCTKWSNEEHRFCQSIDARSNNEVRIRHVYDSKFMKKVILNILFPYVEIEFFTFPMLLITTLLIFVFNCSSRDGILASAELENYESPDSEDSNSFGPPAKRLAGVVLSDSIAEEGQEDDIAMDNIPSFKPSSLTSSTKDDSKKYVQSIRSFILKNILILYAF